MKSYYDIHCHIFNKDVIIRKLVNVVQSLLTIKDILEDQVTEEELKYKIDGINKTLEGVTQEASEDVYNSLDEVYKGKVITTPLMFDLSYADDNDDDEHKNKRYRRRIRRVFKVIIIIIPFLKNRIKRKFDNKELMVAIDRIRDNIKVFHKSFEKKSDEEVEIFDNANYEQQIADLEFLSENYNTIRPFFSVDPRREYKGKINTIENLKQKITSQNGKFSGIKLYSPAGFSPTDPVLMGIDGQQGVYGFCVENNIPITVHNSNAGFACLSNILNVRGHVYLNGAVTEFNGPFKFQNRLFSLKIKEVSGAIPERAKTLNHPKIWALVLDKYPDLTINFAHFGGSTEIMDYINYAIPDIKFDEDEFEDALLPLSPELKNTISSAYSKKRRKMVLKTNLTISERAKIWNALYYSGLTDNWAKGIFDLVKNPKYPNAFTDLSCFSAGTLIQSPENNELTFSIKENLVNFKNNFYKKLSAYEKSKILYGSDFFLAQFFGPTMEQYFADFKSAFGPEFDIIASDNPKRFLKD